MTHSTLASRLVDWFTAWVCRAELGQRRSERHCAAGPVVIRHTFSVDSSHALYLDSLAGVPKPGGVLTVHSFEFAHARDIGPLPWSAADCSPNGRAQGLADTPWRLMYALDGTEIRCFNREQMVGVFITVGSVKYWEYYAPLLAFLYWGAAARGGALVHAGCVGTPTAMGIVGGPSGTGKSTTVLLGMGAGLVSCGDDYIWLEPEASGTMVYLVYRTVKTVVGSGILPMQPERTVRLGNGSKDVHWLVVKSRATDNIDAGGLIQVASLKVGWFLSGTDDPKPASALDLLANLLPSTLFRIPGDERHVSAVLRTVVARLPLVSLPRNGDYEALTRALRCHTQAPNSIDNQVCA